jgi:phosphopentomutase
MTPQRGRRAICLVLDGFGVGDMEGSPERAQPNTFNSIRRLAGEPHLPTLSRLGLYHLVTHQTGAGATGSWGRSRLAHLGADTYLGHQEMMGTIPQAPVATVIAESGDQIIAALAAAGITAQRVEIPGEGAVLVSDRAVIADNIEAARGMNINVTGSLDEVSLEQLMTIGEALRATTKVTRVIVVGGRGYTFPQILDHVRRHEQGHVGVDTPSLGVYDENYRVRHLGLPVPTEHQAPSLAHAAGLPVGLIGKAADVLACPDPEVRDNVIDTAGVFERAFATLDAFDRGLIVANVQETDLAGHEQDADRFRQVLEQVDGGVAELLRRMRPDDLLIITADHGNDPAAGSSQHTREFVPVLTHSPSLPDIALGTRETLADVGATLCKWLDLPAPADGRPMVDVSAARHDAIMGRQ